MQSFIRLGRGIIRCSDVVIKLGDKNQILLQLWKIVCADSPEVVSPAGLQRGAQESERQAHHREQAARFQDGAG